MDEVSYRILTDMQLPQVQLISLADFEKDDFQLLQAKQNRSLIEYYFTCTPSLPLYVMDHDLEVDIITYLDADLYFFSSIKPVYQELGNGSVLIIGHRFPPSLKHLENQGIYNVGMLSFRRDNDGLACLQSWRNNCIEWCYDRVENGRYADQKYLDLWPDNFSGVVVLQYKGAGLAPWNITNYVYSWTNGVFLVDEQPLIVYHFEGLKWINRWIYDTNISTSYKMRLPQLVKKCLYFPYIKELNNIKHDLQIFPKVNLAQVQSIRAPITSKTKQIKIHNLPKQVINSLKFCQNLLYFIKSKLQKLLSKDLFIILQ
jgi:hypothetical protein